MPKQIQPPRLDLRWQCRLNDYVIALDWSNDRRWLAAAEVSGPISVFDADTGERRFHWPGHHFGTAAIGFSPDGSRFASVGQDGKVAWYDLQTGTVTTTADGGAAWVEHLAWSPSGNLLATGAGKKLRCWSATGELVRTYPDLAGTIADLAWNPKTKRLTVGHYGGITHLSPSQDQENDFWEHRGSILRIAWSPDGRYLAAGTQTQEVLLWLAKSGKNLEMTGYPVKVQTLAWSPNSQYLATGGSASVTLWDCSGRGPAGTRPLCLEEHSELISALAYQKRGVLLASGCQQGWLKLWYPGGYTRSLAQVKLGEAISQLKWSPLDNCLAVGGDQGRLAVYNV